MNNSTDGKSCHAVRPRECGAVGEEGGADVREDDEDEEEGDIDAEAFREVERLVEPKLPSIEDV